MLSEVQPLSSGHSMSIHDIQFDYYGDKLASCGSDGYIYIYDVSKKQTLASIKVRDSPLFSLQWGHPRFGSVLAVSSYDGDVTVYKEEKDWIKAVSHQSDGSVNCIGFVPHELILACGSSDGHIFILDNNNQWNVVNKWLAHESSVHGLSWNKEGTLLATGGADKQIKIWEFNAITNQPILKTSLQAHQEIVKNVIFHPLDDSIVVSGGDDGKLKIFKITQHSLVEIQEIDFHSPIWKISFNLVGSLLSVSLENNAQVVTLKEDDNNKYININVY